MPANITKLTNCPNCGKHTAGQQVNFNRETPGSMTLANLMPALFSGRKRSGRYCEHCRTMFSVTKSAIPGIYYLWILMLVLMTSAMIVILYLLVIGH